MIHREEIRANHSLYISQEKRKMLHCYSYFILTETALHLLLVKMKIL